MARFVFALVALIGLGGCQDVSIGRQLPRDGGVDVRRERVLPLPDGELTLRALDVGPGGEVVLLAQLTGRGDLGDGEVHTATTDGGDGALLVFEPDGTLRTKRLLTAEFLTVYRAVVDGSNVHIAGLFRGALSDGDPLGDSPTGQAAALIAYELDGARTDTRVLSSTNGFRNVQGKGVDVSGERVLRCGNYVGQLDAGDGLQPEAGISGDNAFVTVADASGTVWTDATSTPESGARGAYGQNCAFAPDGAVLVGIDYDGDATVHGEVRGADGLDGLVMAYAPDGTPRWATTVGGPGDQELNPLATRADLVMVGGSSTAPFDLGGVAVDGSVFVAALDLDGAPRWAWSVDGPSAVTALDASGVDTVASGFFGQAVDALGWAPVGGTDGFVAGLDDEGAVRWSHTFGSAGSDTCLGHASGDEVVVVCSFGAALESPGGTPIPDGGALWIGHVAVRR